jgi:prepilin-type N-terminal cleavage/methylation domain-containing protein
MKKAFTLIELLIVVAIIAILAAIAVPNFIEAQTRAKISRTKNDMRTLTTALESYMTDYNSYPPCLQNGVPAPPRGQGPAYPTGMLRLSTPIGYITQAIYPNPFNATQRISASSAAAIAQAGANPTPATVFPVDFPNDPAFRSYLYHSGSNQFRSLDLNSTYVPPTNPDDKQPARKWILHSPGPTLYYFNLGGVLANSSGDPGTAGSLYADCMNLVYDPTNGTSSFGAIWRVGGTAGNSFYGQQMMKVAQETGR